MNKLIYALEALVLNSNKYFKDVPTSFWLKCINPSKCTEFSSTDKLDVATADKYFGLLTKNYLMDWIGKYEVLKTAYQAIFGFVYWNL